MILVNDRVLTVIIAFILKFFTQINFKKTNEAECRNYKNHRKRKDKGLVEHTFNDKNSFT